jgi:hypothetical protein
MLIYRWKGEAMKSPYFDSICTCRCGSCLTHDHLNCINPSHVAAFKASVEFEGGLRQREADPT